MATHPLCKTTDLNPGQCMSLEVAGKDIAVYNVGGAFHATDDFCLHRGGHLGEGKLDDSTITCPLHGWQYNVTSGECLTNPQAQLTSYPVSVSGDQVSVEI